VLVVALVTMLAPLNSTMIAVALPRITTEFGSDFAATGWLVTGYLLVMASLQPIAGKLGDRHGRRWFILGGLIYFAVASLGAALTTSLPLLIFFRIQQAVAGALALPNGTALIRELVPAERRASRFGFVGALISLAAAGGPPLGGVLIEWGGWQAIFYVNLVFIVPAMILGWRIQFSKPKKEVEPPPFDLFGAVGITVILVALAVIGINFNQLGWMWGLVFAGVILIFTRIFVQKELKHPDPILKLNLFRSKTFVAAAGGVCLSNLSMYTTFLVMPILLSARFNWGEAEVGLALTALFASNIALAPLGGRLADLWGRRWPTMLGMLFLGLGMLPLAILGSQIDLWVLLLSLVVAGVGIGLSSAGLQTSAIESAPAKDAGIASGVFSTSRYFGSIVGSSIMAGLLSTNQSQFQGINLIFILATATAFAALFLSFRLNHFPEKI